MIICGVDPGLDGAFAFYDTNVRMIVSSFSMPVDVVAKGKGTKREINWSILWWTISDAVFHFGKPSQAFVERVSSSPQMGVTSAFNFGRSYGGLECLFPALGWPAEYVTPQQWKKALKVPAEKDDAVHRASKLLPNSVNHWSIMRGVINKPQASGLAEASLICLYGEMWLAERGLLRPATQKRRLSA